MSQSAAPPVLDVCACADIVWSQHCIFLCVPLRSYRRIECLQIIVARLHHTVCAYQTAISFVGSRNNFGLPFMSAWAKPPNTFSRSIRHLFRGKRSVFAWMPLCGKIRIVRDQIIKTRKHFYSCTVRTAAASLCPSCDLHLVIMSFFAYPPCFAVGEWCDLIRLQHAILFAIPLRCNLRKGRLQVIISTDNDFSCTNRTTIAARNTRGYHSTPAMSPFATPPHFFHRSATNLCWLEIPVVYVVPLCHKLRVYGCKRVVFCKDLSVCAVRAFTAMRFQPNLCSIAVPLFTLPPHLAVTVGKNIIGCLRIIFLYIPAFDQFRIKSSQRVMLVCFFPEQYGHFFPIVLS